MINESLCDFWIKINLLTYQGYSGLPLTQTYSEFEGIYKYILDQKLLPDVTLGY